jgi:hypothetical protein
VKAPYKSRSVEGRKATFDGQVNRSTRRRPHLTTTDAELCGRSGGEGRRPCGAAALVDGAVGVVVAPQGRHLMVLRFTIVSGRIVEIDSVADPERLGRLELAVLDD